MWEDISELSTEQTEHLWGMYQKEWWTRGRRLEDVTQMLHGSALVFGICRADSKELVAFARVLTDGIYRAFVFDVIVAEEYRGQGLGTRLVERMQSHPALSRIEQIQLTCLPERIEFYAKAGFAPSPQTHLIYRPEQRTATPDLI